MEVGERHESFVLFLDAVGAGGFASILSCYIIINMSSLTISFSYIEATPNYFGQLCRHKGLIKSEVPFLLKMRGPRTALSEAMPYLFTLFSFLGGIV